MCVCVIPFPDTFVSTLINSKPVKHFNKMLNKINQHNSLSFVFQSDFLFCHHKKPGDSEKSVTQVIRCEVKIGRKIGNNYLNY